VFIDLKVIFVCLAVCVFFVVTVIVVVFWFYRRVRKIKLL